MAIDFGLLGALSGRKNWDGIKAERQRELQYQAAINQMQEQDIAKQQQNAAAINNYLNTASQLKVLPKGRERIQEIEGQYRQPIVEAIKKYGGDLNKYMAVQGMPDLQNYLNGFLNHPTTVKELNNAANVSKWQADQEAGLQERLDFDPTTGSFGDPFHNKLLKYNTGDIDSLDYAGGFKPAKADESFYGKTYGSANRYKSLPVTQADYLNTTYRQLRASGLNERDAMQQAHELASGYADQVKGGTPLRWKSDKWTPTKAWEDAHAADISAKYIVDSFNALLNPNNTQIWTGVPTNNAQINQIVNGLGLPASMIPQVQQADVLPDFSLGKKTITYNKQKGKYDENGNITGSEVEKITEPVEDSFLPFLKIGGKVYMQTRANQLEGKPPVLLTDGAIDRTFAGVSKSAAVLKTIASLRKALKENNNLSKEGRPDFQSDNATPVYFDANGNEVDLTDATPEQIADAISGGLITQQ